MTLHGLSGSSHRVLGEAFFLRVKTAICLLNGVYLNITFLSAGFGEPHGCTVELRAQLNGAPESRELEYDISCILHTKTISSFSGDIVEEERFTAHSSIRK